jgi:hypothetical protein
MKKKISAKERARRADQARKQWEKDNPGVVAGLQLLAAEPVIKRHTSIIYR